MYCRTGSGDFLLLRPEAATARTPVKALRYRSDPPGAAFAAALTEAPRRRCSEREAQARANIALRERKNQMQVTESKDLVSRETDSLKPDNALRNHAKELVDDGLT